MSNIKTTGDLREFLTEVMEEVRAAKLTVDRASSVIKAAAQINESFYSEIKTKAFLAVMETLKLENALIVTAGQDENLVRSSRNVPAVKVLRAEGLNVYDILKFRTLVLTEPALKSPFE